MRRGGAVVVSVDRRGQELGDQRRLGGVAVVIQRHVQPESQSAGARRQPNADDGESEEAAEQVTGHAGGVSQNDLSSVKARQNKKG